MTFRWPDRMEIGCVRAGHWLIEGYTVLRTNAGWEIHDRYKTEDGEQVDRLVDTVNTLEDACYVIDDDRQAGREQSDATS